MLLNPILNSQFSIHFTNWTEHIQWDHFVVSDRKCVLFFSPLSALHRSNLRQSPSIFHVHLSRKIYPYIQRTFSSLPQNRAFMWFINIKNGKFLIVAFKDSYCWRVWDKATLNRGWWKSRISISFWTNHFYHKSALSPFCCVNIGS